jgi:hypothetical protein
MLKLFKIVCNVCMYLISSLAPREREKEKKRQCRKNIIFTHTHTHTTMSKKNQQSQKVNDEMDSRVCESAGHIPLPPGSLPSPPLPPSSLLTHHPTSVSIPPISKNAYQKPCYKLDDFTAPLAPAGDWGRKRSDREKEGGNGVDFFLG